MKPGYSSGKNMLAKWKPALLITGTLFILFIITGILTVFYVLVPYRNRKSRAIAESDKVQIESFDHLNLVAELRTQKDISHHWAILVHSYRTDHSVMHRFGQYYFQKGYNILSPDNRCHGLSEGKYFGMGYLDRLDILNWLQYILSVDPEAEIVLHGLSMGASTALMVSGENNVATSQIKAIIADCGYASAESYLTNKLYQRFHLPPFPIIDIANIAFKVSAGYFMKDASVVSFVKNSNIPTLIIHGDQDQSVPVEDAYEIYEALPSYKELYIIKGAEHSQCLDADPEAYWNNITDFLSSHGL